MKNFFKNIFSNKKVVSILKFFVFVLLLFIFGYFIFTGNQL